MEPSLPSLVGADTKAYLLHLLIVLVCLVEKREGDGDQEQRQKRSKFKQDQGI